MGVPGRCVRITRFYYDVKERPDALLLKEFAEAESTFSSCVTAVLLPHQREAVLCLISDLIGGYGYGAQTFQGSEMVRALNSNMLQIASAEFSKFCYFNGRVDSRVWHKRRCEQNYFIRGEVLYS